MMNECINYYLSFFSEKSDFIKGEIHKCYEYWMPEYPPTLLLFALVGKSLVKQLDVFNALDAKLIFQHIEEGMNSPCDELATAVATGLIESMVTASDNDETIWNKLENSMHVETKKHALAWKNFGQ